MPELPEVETTRRGIEPHIQGCTVAQVIVRNARLRWPVPGNIDQLLSGKTIKKITRRAKYLLLDTGCGHLIVHLGMSGSLRVLTSPAPAGKHDHVDIVMTNGLRLRYTDPRRFGALLWTEDTPEQHTLLKHLGPEPLNALDDKGSDAFTADRLYQMSRGKKQAIKTFIMDNKVVVGVGNIYASEALFHAGIRPNRACGSISRHRYKRLVDCIRETLAKAIAEGGTTLRDFVGGDGRPGYFKQSLAVYGREGEPCLRCGTIIKLIKLGNRSSCYCHRCQR